MRHDAIGDHVLYELGTNWYDLHKLQVSETDDTLPTVFATLPKTISSELGVERSEAPGPEGTDLDNETCLSNKIVIYSTAGRREPSGGG